MLYIYISKMREVPINMDIDIDMFIVYGLI